MILSAPQITVNDLNRKYNPVVLCFAAFILLFLASCNHLFIDEQKSNTAQNNFDLLWQIFDERYCFFGEKGVDWDQMYYKHCRNWTNRGGIDPSSPQLFTAMASMLEELRDGHVSIDNGSNSRTFSGWHTSYPENFNFNLVNDYRNQDRNTVCLNDTRHIHHSSGSYSGCNGAFLSVLPESIGYIRCPSLSDKFNRNNLDNAMAKFNGVKGVIIDVRNNGGGLVTEAYMLASRFVREKTHVGYVRYKSGKGHNDFSDYFARYVEPDGTNPFHGKVVVVTNRKVYSAANLFVSIMSVLPQVCIMGDNTGGGGGVPTSAELYNGWTVKISTNPVFDIEKRSIESGVKPDYFIELGKDAQKDHIIETAKAWILAK